MIEIKRFTIACIIVAFLSTGIYLGVKTLTNNSDAIHDRCLSNNANLIKINTKFKTLTNLFDAAGGASNQSPEIKKLYAEFKKPISLAECK